MFSVSGRVKFSSPTEARLPELHAPRSNKQQGVTGCQEWTPPPAALGPRLCPTWQLEPSPARLRDVAAGSKTSKAEYISQRHACRTLTCAVTVCHRQGMALNSTYV